MVIAAAVTADAAREAADPAPILAVNLAAMVPILEACRRAGVRRVVNLSSAAAYGAVPATCCPRICRPAESLYAVTKFASEKVLARLCGHWGLDGVSVRLSAVFGPFERDTALRDTLSPQAQIWAAAQAEPRPCCRGRLARLALRARRGAGGRAADRGGAAGPPALQRVEPRGLAGPGLGRAAGGEPDLVRPGFVCRLAEAGEIPTVSLHGDRDGRRSPPDALRDELGWEAAHGLDASADAFLAWQRHSQEDPR